MTSSHITHQPPTAIDMRGQRVARWTVTGKAESRERRAWWVCRCDCGEIREISGNALRAPERRQRELRCWRCEAVQ